MSDAKRGHLYLLSNQWMPGLLKIGITARSPYERADELSHTTGVPGRFKVERSWRVNDAPAAERCVHDAFRRYRVSGEHFRMPLADAIERIEAMQLGSRSTWPTWRIYLERLATVLALLAAYWPTARRLHRILRATFRAGLKQR